MPCVADHCTLVKMPAKDRSRLDANYQHKEQQNKDDNVAKRWLAVVKLEGHQA